MNVRALSEIWPGKAYPLSQTANPTVVINEIAYRPAAGDDAEPVGGGELMTLGRQLSALLLVAPKRREQGE